jgi:hypothetical protein
LLELGWKFVRVHVELVATGASKLHRHPVFPNFPLAICSSETRGLQPQCGPQGASGGFTGPVPFVNAVHAASAAPFAFSTATSDSVPLHVFRERTGFLRHHHSILFFYG